MTHSENSLLGREADISYTFNQNVSVLSPNYDIFDSHSGDTMHIQFLTFDTHQLKLTKMVEWCFLQNRKVVCRTMKLDFYLFISIFAQQNWKKKCSYVECVCVCGWFLFFWFFARIEMIVLLRYEDVRFGFMCRSARAQTFGWVKWKFRMRDI